MRPACWIDTPDRYSSSVARAVQDAWDIYRDELGLVPPDVVRRPFFLGRTVGLPFWEEPCYESVVGVLEAELLVAGDPVGYIGLVKGMRLMCTVPSTLLTHLLAPVLSLMFSSGFGPMGLLSPGWLREDLGSRTCAWLRPDFVPPSPFLVIKDFSRLSRSQNLI